MALPDDPAERLTERFAVDHIEAGIAVLEDEAGRIFELPVRLLPLGVEGGEVLLVSGHRNGRRSLLVVRPDSEERARRLARARGILERLQREDDGEDIEL